MLLALVMPTEPACAVRAYQPLFYTAFPVEFQCDDIVKQSVFRPEVRVSVRDIRAATGATGAPATRPRATRPPADYPSHGRDLRLARKIVKTFC
jgi:hypothetical protein